MSKTSSSIRFSANAATKVDLGQRAKSWAHSVTSQLSAKAHWLVIVGVAVLLAEPVQWLARTWISPSYNSSGYLFAGIALGLFCWSASSTFAHSTPRRHSHRIAFVLLLTSACVRLGGQILAINLLSALTIVVDVFAVSLLLGLHRRVRAVSPLWLAGLVFLSLPIDRLFQRFAGFVLQDWSATGACRVLGQLYDQVHCQGTHLMVQGQSIMVDLPCSGTVALLVTLGVFAGLAAVRRPGAVQAIMWLAIIVGLSIALNILRIVALSVGLVADLPVMAEPWHTSVGLVTLTLSLLPLLIWMPARGHKPSDDGPQTPVEPGGKAGGLPLWLAATFLVACLFVTKAPRQALDSSGPVTPILMPASLQAYPANPQALSAPEAAYYQQHGGQAQKALYGPIGLTVVRTTSPLRHMHAPEDCLRGLGFDVRYLGVTTGPRPMAHYLVTDADGNRWQATSLFMSSAGVVTANVSEVIWTWLSNPGPQWTSVQILIPDNFSQDQQALWRGAVFAALDVPTQSLPPASILNQHLTDNEA